MNIGSNSYASTVKGSLSVSRGYIKNENKDQQGKGRSPDTPHPPIQGIQKATKQNRELT
jgi:hypothetical protein